MKYQVKCQYTNAAKQNVTFQVTLNMIGDNNAFAPEAARIAHAMAQGMRADDMDVEVLLLGSEPALTNL